MPWKGPPEHGAHGACVLNEGTGLTARDAAVTWRRPPPGRHGHYFPGTSGLLFPHRKVSRRATACGVKAISPLQSSLHVEVFLRSKVYRPMLSFMPLFNDAQRPQGRMGQTVSYPFHCNVNQGFSTLLTVGLRDPLGWGVFCWRCLHSTPASTTEC